MVLFADTKKNFKTHLKMQCVCRFFSRITYLINMQRKTVQRMAQEECKENFEDWDTVLGTKERTL